MSGKARRREIDDLRKCKSVKIWFTRGNHGKGYVKETEENYLRDLYLFCGIVHKNPDELANINSEEALRIQRQIIQRIGAARHFVKISQIRVLHSLWKANGVQITKALETYDGTPWRVFK